MRYRWLMEAMPTMAMLIPLEAMAMMVMVMVVTTEELTAEALSAELEAELQAMPSAVLEADELTVEEELPELTVTMVVALALPKAMEAELSELVKAEAMPTMAMWIPLEAMAMMAMLLQVKVMAVMVMDELTVVLAAEELEAKELEAEL